MKIVYLTTSISRQSGGLFYSTRVLAKILNDKKNINIEVLSVDDGYKNDIQKDWSPITPVISKRTGPYWFCYSKDLKNQLSDIDPDILHNQHLWKYPSIVTNDWSKKNKKPYVISPNGMLDPWALKNAVIKKYIARILYENSHLRNAACIHALCESEAKSIRKFGLNNPISIIPNGVKIPELIDIEYPCPWNENDTKDKKVLLFLGRLHEKKGLSILLESINKLKANNNKRLQDWVIILAGWGDNNYVKKLKSYVNNANLNKEVIFTGPLFNKEKEAALRKANAFILPSYSEGLPISVLEAWSYSIPVLMTKQCNLEIGFHTSSALEINLNSESIYNKLNDFFSLRDDVLLEVGLNGLNLVKNHYSWENVSNKHVEVYKWLAGNSEMPSCVLY